MKKLIALVLALVLVLSLTACAGKKDDGKLIVGASPAPHAEILEFVKPMMAEKGITLEIQEFTDYVLPNQALDAGDIDANYFQHLPYLLNFNENNGTKLASAAAIHFEPLGIYAGKSSDLTNIPEGAVISVPNDATNEARALLVLEQVGLIKLKEGVGINATKADIVETPKNIEVYEAKAELIPTLLQDVDLAVINGNYAIDAGMKFADALAIEANDGAAAKEYVNIIAVKEGNENSEKIQALIKALMSEEVKTFIETTYGGAVVPMF